MLGPRLSALSPEIWKIVLYLVGGSLLVAFYPRVNQSFSMQVRLGAFLICGIGQIWAQRAMRRSRGVAAGLAVVGVAVGLAIALISVTSFVIGCATVVVAGPLFGPRPEARESSVSPLHDSEIPVVR